MRHIKIGGSVVVCSLMSLCYAQEEYEMHHDNEEHVASQESGAPRPEIDHAGGTEYSGKEQTSSAGKQALPGSSIVWQEGVVPPHQSENHERGNWLKKLEYFRRAGAVYQKNEEDVHQVEAAYKKFHDLCYGEGQRLRTLLNALGVKEQDVAYLAEQGGELLSSPQRAAELKITLNKQEIDHQLDILASGFKDVATLFKTLDEVVAAGERMRATGQSYIDLSWQKYVAIDSTYNDQQAKMLLEEMQAMNEHLLAMVTYINRDLTEYCHQRITLLTEHIHTLEQARDALRKGGFPITMDEFSRLQKQPQEQNKTEKPSETVWSNAWNAMTFPFRWIWGGMQRLYHVFI
jgi:hypothetical protein